MTARTRLLPLTALAVWIFGNILAYAYWGREFTAPASMEDTVGRALGSFITLCWLVCMIEWLRRGVSVPKYIHVVALTTTFIGIACAAAFAFYGLLTTTLAIGLVVIPSVATYFGWVWMFGPSWSETSNP